MLARVGAPLDSVDEKLKQGRRHMEALRVAFHKAVDAGPITFGLEPDGDQGWHLAKVHHVPELPVHLSVILGDAVHNFRSTLDHLTWQLALLQNANPSGRTQFPITMSEEEFRSQADRIADLDPAHRAIIERRQPYKTAREASPLRLLRDLSNRDKHRVIATLIVTPEAYDVKLEGVNCTVEEVEWPPPGERLATGSTLARLRLSGVTTDPHVRMLGHVVPDLQLEDGDSAFVALLHIGGEVLSIVREFERILEPRPLLTPSSRRWANFSTFP